MKNRLFILIILAVGTKVCGQNWPLSGNLTANQQAKIGRITSPSKKLSKYRKYYSKDSLKAVKKYDKLAQEKWDHGFDQVQTKANKRLRTVRSRERKTTSSASISNRSS